MIEKLKNDETIFQKAGFVLGGLVGVLLGLVISDRADKFENREVRTHGEERSEPGQSSGE